LSFPENGVPAWSSILLGAVLEPHLEKLARIGTFRSVCISERADLIIANQAGPAQARGLDLALVRYANRAEMSRSWQALQMGFQYGSQ